MRFIVLLFLSIKILIFSLFLLSLIWSSTNLRMSSKCIFGSDILPLILCCHSTIQFITSPVRIWICSVSHTHKRAYLVKPPWWLLRMMFANKHFKYSQLNRVWNRHYAMAGPGSRKYLLTVTSLRQVRVRYL